MHSLPLELHAQIFEYACVDDGTTARSLALVSRYVREVSEPFRYQSLSVAGLNSLTELEQRLAALPPHRRRTRHLFLSDWTRAEACAKAAASDDAAMARYDREQAALAHILDTVAPTLETLALHTACPYNSTAVLGHLFALRLPRLRALAVHGFYPFPRLPAAMPRLERLRLSGNRNPHGLLLSRGLALACPQLRELTVAGLVSAVAFADEAQTALVAASPAPAPFTPAVPAQLKKVVLEVGPRPSSSRRYAAARAQHEKMLEIFRSISGRGGSAGVRVEVVEGGNSGAHPYDLLRRGW